MMMTKHVFVFLTFISAPLIAGIAAAQDQAIAAEGEGQPQGKPQQQGALAPAVVVSDPSLAKEERTGLLWIFPAAYGSLELRHVIQRKMTRDQGFVHVRGGSPNLLGSKHAVSDSPHWLFRPTVGSTFFDGELDSSFTYSFSNDVGSSELRKVDVTNSTQWNVIKGNFNASSPYLLGPSADTSLFDGSKNGTGFSYSDIGFFGELSSLFSVPSGTLNVRGYLNPVVELYSHEQNEKSRSTLIRSVDQGSRSGLSSSRLVDTDAQPDEPMAARQKHPMYLASYGIAGTYQPHWSTKLALGLGLDVIQSWKPVYKETVVPGQTETTVKRDGYARDAVSYARLTVKYDFTKRVSLVNQVRHYTAGIWDRGISIDNPDTSGQVGAIAWENRLSLNVSLF